MNRLVWNHQYFEKIALNKNFWDASENFPIEFIIYIAPSSGHILLVLNLPFKLIQGGMRLFSDIWSENAALFERLLEIHSNPPILYYGFNFN